MPKQVLLEFKKQKKTERPSPYNFKNSQGSICETPNVEQSPSSSLSQIDSNLNDQNNLSINKMNNSTISLQELTAFTKILPSYSPGDNLAQFIQTTERILDRLRNYNPSAFQNDLVIETVLGNILGDAAVAISYETHTCWDTIKNALIKYYGDNRSLSLLESDLRRLIRGKNEPTHSYYQRVVKAQNDLIQYIQLNEKNEIIKNHEIEKIKASVLKQFIYGVGDPYYTKLSYVPPDTLEKALLSCQQLDTENLEINLIRRTFQLAPTQSKSNPPFQSNIRPQIQPQQNHFKNQNFPNFNHPFKNNFSQNPQNNSPQFNRPNLPQFQNNTSAIQRPPFFNRQPFHKEAPRPQPSTSFQNRPTPMSGVSSINKSFQKRTPNFANQSRPTFTSQELYNLETPQETDDELCQELTNMDLYDSTQYSYDEPDYPQDYVNSPNEPQNQDFPTIPNQNELT